MNKKSLAMQTLIWILFLTIAFILIVGLIKTFFGKAEGKIAEDICRGNIVLRAKTTVEKVGVEIKTVPLLCKTLDKEITTKKELADLISKCWWIMGEGLLENAYGSNLFWGGQRCFSCYTVKIKGDLSIDSKEYKRIYLAETVYKVSEETDNCRLFGGWCVENKDKCIELSEEKGFDWNRDYFKTDDDTKCKEGENKICCYSPYDCLNKNKGGECFLNPPEEEGYLKYDKWNCPDNKECYIKKGYYNTYLDYVQGYAKGKIIFESETLMINKEDIYAISFVSKTENDWFVDRWPWIEEGKMSMILVSRLNDVKKHCNLQLGVG